MEVLAFGSLESPDSMGRTDVDLVVLESRAVRVAVITYGASLHTVDAPDQHGRREPICLSLPMLGELVDHARTSYLGTTCGRWANRVVGASYAVDRTRVVLDRNDGEASLHGGSEGFSRRIWTLSEATATDDGGSTTFALHSPDGDQGHPGAVDVTATYTLRGHTLRITYAATADAPTAVNLTNHAYWNLAGPSAWSQAQSIADHQLRVDAALVLGCDERSLPTGPLAPVEDHDLDLRVSRPLGEVLASRSSGIDHSFGIGSAVHPFAPGAMRMAGELGHPQSGRTLTVATDQPAVHVYTANHLTTPFARQAAVCLETQRFPDAPNRPDLGPSIVRPGEQYLARTEVTFGVR